MNRQHLVATLEESESSELREWGTRIKNFSLSHEEAYRVKTLITIIKDLFRHYQVMK